MESTYYNICDATYSEVEPSSDVTIGDFASVIAAKKKNNCQDFHEEYKVSVEVNVGG
jgi:hypothetical protein